MTKTTKTGIVLSILILYKILFFFKKINLAVSMCYLVCGKCKERKLQVTTPKKLKTMMESNQLPVNSAISPEVILAILGILGAIVKFLINENKSITSLIDKGLTIRQIVKLTGRSSTTVCKMIKTLKMNRNE